MVAKPNSRRALRRAVDVPCEIITFDVDQPMAGRALDLSPFGMWAVSRQPFAVGERVVVSFRPPYWDEPAELTLFGEVARVTMERCGRGGTATGLGIEFTGMTDDERAALGRCLMGTPPPIPPHLQHAR
ncbi:MAG: PilZ domain-containing protein [Deltaproteobacteria bacterium]|jgi:hypothetical protein|nr:PilZ domain-containing protein [Deltaproteobacteria bacterium]MBW2532536.1 PilZ domain-containing protein [Deltaproteobacteria bacterium]